MAAPTAAEYGTAADSLISLRELNNFDQAQTDLMQTGIRAIIGRIQELADGGDATAQAYLNTKRKFMKNVSGSAQTVTYNNQVVSFADTERSCVDTDELRYFLEKNTSLQAGTLADWLTTTTIRTFYW